MDFKRALDVVVFEISGVALRCAINATQGITARHLPLLHASHVLLESILLHRDFLIPKKLSTQSFHIKRLRYLLRLHVIHPDWIQ